jgi:hypothetical protein
MRCALLVPFAPANYLAVKSRAEKLLGIDRYTLATLLGLLGS